MNIVLVLRKGRGFGERDVELLARHIRRTTPDANIICLANIPIRIEGVEYVPMFNNWNKWWCRMELYSPSLKHFRPFLYVDLDTVVLGDLNNIINAIPDKKMYIPLEDFYQKGKLATGLLWMPRDNPKINQVWIEWLKARCPDTEKRMDYFLREVIEPDAFWQQITDQVISFKPKGKQLQEKPNKSVVCFHGKPSIWEANVEWVKQYRNE